MRVVSSTIEVLTPTCIALGNFDGVHRGHKRVIEPAVNAARLAAVGSSVSNNVAPYPTVVTFDPHPREFFSGNPKRLLTPLPEKVDVLSNLGVEQLVLLPFDRELSALTPQEFVAEILVRRLKTQSISIGMDFCFGRGRSGDSTDLKAIAADYGIEVNIATLYKEADQRISSSAIREALAGGDLHLANKLLGRNYTLQGTVVHGQKLGHKIGFPTANLNLSTTKFLPKYGVYAVRVDGETLNEVQWGILNVGCRPTVDPTAKNPTVEVHLFDCEKDLYGEILSLELLHYIRSEQKFDSLQSLQSQIQQDCELTKTLLTKAK